jgi:hypothetical protein
MNVRLSCAAALAALGMTIRGDAPPPEPKPEPTVREEAPVIRPALMLPSMRPATLQVSVSAQKA